MDDNPISTSPLPAIVVVVLATCAACAALPPPSPDEHLDARTGATLIVMDQPFVFARERKDVAANARDYVTLVAVSSNVVGSIRYALVAHRWSTVDTRMAVRTDASKASLVLVADGRDVRLVPFVSAPPEMRDDAAFHRPPVSDVQTLAYPVDRETLAYLATSNSLTISFDIPADALPYAGWSRGQAALARFLAALPAGPARR